MMLIMMIMLTIIKNYEIMLMMMITLTMINKR